MSKRRMKKNDILGLAVLLLIIAGLLLIAYLIVKNLTGNTTITNSDGQIEESQSLRCESDKVKYPLLEQETGEKSFLETNAVFENNKLASISLTYKMFFSDKSAIEQKETDVRIAMNRHFSSDGLSADTFNSNYAKLNDAMQYSLFAKREELNSTTMKYFMLEDTAGKYSQESVRKVYEDLGLKCVVKK